MKKVILLLFIFPLLTGCLTTVQPEQNIVQFPGDYEDDKIEYVAFNIPYTITTPVNVTFTIYRPDGSSPGTYSAIATNRETQIRIGKTSLYYPGMWKVTYTFGDQAEGNQYIWVEDKEKDLDRYIVEDYVDSGSNVDFYVFNSGKEAGYVDIIVHATNPLTVGEKQYFDKTFLQRDEYIRPGHRKKISLTITETSSLTIILNNVEHKYGG